MSGYKSKFNPSKAIAGVIAVRLPVRDAIKEEIVFQKLDKALHPQSVCNKLPTVSGCYISNIGKIKMGISCISLYGVKYQRFNIFWEFSQCSMHEDTELLIFFYFFFRKMLLNFCKLTCNMRLYSSKFKTQELSRQVYTIAISKHNVNRIQVPTREVGKCVE